MADPTSENRLLSLANRAAAQDWDTERAVRELETVLTDRLSSEELRAAIQAIAGRDLPVDVAVWIDHLTAILMAVSSAEEQAGPLHLALAAAWLQRAQAGEPGGYVRVLHHCQAARPLVPPDDPNYPALLQIEAAAQAPLDRLQRLLGAEDEGTLVIVVDEWPEAPGLEVQQTLRALAETARHAGDEETAAQAEATQARLQALRMARPQDAALADFLTTQTWGEARMLVQATAMLQDWAMVERLATLAERARARGEEQKAQHYEAHQRQLAGWLKVRQHPLLQLAYRVRQRDVSLSQALEEVLKPEMVTSVDEEMLDALDDQVGSLALGDLLLAYILARLNDTIAPRVAGPRVRAHCALWVGQLGAGMGEADLAMERLDQALELYRAIGDRQGQAHALRSIGEVQRVQAQDAAALASYQAALGLYMAVGDRGGLINTHGAIGRVWQQSGNPSQAYQAYGNALKYVEDMRGLPTAGRITPRRFGAGGLPVCGYGPHLPGAGPY